ncbi:hypothetical protein C4J85_3439 [Pseudomonas sp. R4-34-07]|nr:hypothetical protein C4J85_3439 [Pseudomonas sp. R4-34-07]
MGMGEVGQGLDHGGGLTVIEVLPLMGDRSHALRGNASLDALRPLLERGASLAAFPRRAWE